MKSHDLGLGGAYVETFNSNRGAEMPYLIGDVVWPSRTSASKLKENPARVSVDDGRQTCLVPNLAPEGVERMGLVGIGALAWLACLQPPVEQDIRMISLGHSGDRIVYDEAGRGNPNG
jgi:hypothetical protein